MADTRAWTIGRRAAAFRRLPWRERRLLVHAVLALPAARALVGCAGVRRVHAVLDRLPVPAAGRLPRHPDGVVHATLRIVRAASTHGVVTGSCLHRALVAWWLLRRQGIPTRLRIGVRRRDGRLDAHAWLEHAGVAVVADGDDDGGGYVPLAWRRDS